MQNLHLTFVCSQKEGKDFAKLFGLLRIHEQLYKRMIPSVFSEGFQGKNPNKYYGMMPLKIDGSIVRRRG